MIRTFWNHDKFIRIIKFNKDKSQEVTYYERDKFKPLFLVNPNHAFNFKGYTTFVITENSAETIDPLNFESKFDVSAFKTAINSKLISETFETLKTSKIDWVKLVIIANLLATLLLIYLQFRK